MWRRVSRAFGRVFSILTVLLVLTGATTTMSQTTPSIDEEVALVGGTIYASDTAEPLRDGVVLIRGSKIVSVGARMDVELPESAVSIDCTGQTITAGFWNSHVHFFERKWADVPAIPTQELERQLEEMLTQYGFTSVFDTGSTWSNTQALRDRIESGELRGPRIRSTGEALIAPEAMPSATILRVLGYLSMEAPEVSDGSQAGRAARALLDAGVDGIKVHLQPPPQPLEPMPEEAIQAAAGAARRAGKPSFAHPSQATDVLAAVRAGVEVIAHTTPGSGPWDGSLIEAMLEAKVALTPTLTLWKSFMRHDRLSVQQMMTDTAVGQLRSWVDAGGEVLFGTDLGAVDYDPIPEYLLMTEAGMSYRQILASLTTSPSARFGDGEAAGRVEPGAVADIVVLEADPAEEIAALGRVRMTLRAGKIVYRHPE